MLTTQQKYNDITRNVGINNKVHVIDLANALEKDSKYYRDFMHFTPEGSDRISDILFESLQQVLGSMGVREKHVQ